jgi:predicted nucleotide-binding protein
VVLLTPDDEGREVGSKDPLSPRARQNVVLELGFFVGRLGRKCVCAIFRGVEIPSDYLGVLYIPLDEGGAWQLRLAKELKAAGFGVDMNRAV